MEGSKLPSMQKKIAIKNFKMFRKVRAMQKIEFEQCAIAFLDILGFKDFIKNAEIVSSEQFLQLCQLQEIIEQQIDVSSEQAFEEERGFCPEMQPECTSISDSIILSAPIRKTDGNVYFSGLTTVAIKTIQIAHQLLKMGFLIRGGIAVGSVFHKDRNIFGSGYVNAWQTQENEACNPRVLLHESAAKLLNGDEKHLGCRLGDGHDICWVKEHEQWIVNTLSPHWSHIGGKSECPNELFLGYRNTIIKNLNDPKHPLGSSVRGKWEWMAGYFNETLKNCSDVREVETIVLPFPSSPFRGWGITKEINSRSFIAEHPMYDKAR
jgi:hypothetical protein